MHGRRRRSLRRSNSYRSGGPMQGNDAPTAPQDGARHDLTRRTEDMASALRRPRYTRRNSQPTTVAAPEPAIRFITLRWPPRIPALCLGILQQVRTRKRSHTQDGFFGAGSNKTCPISGFYLRVFSGDVHAIQCRGRLVPLQPQNRGGRFTR